MHPRPLSPYPRKLRAPQTSVPTPQEALRVPRSSPTLRPEQTWRRVRRLLSGKRGLRFLCSGLRPAPVSPDLAVVTKAYCPEVRVPRGLQAST